MSEFLKSTSVLVSLPTLIYVGLAHRRNRLELIKSMGSSGFSNDVKLDNFLSIPYEFIPLFICLVYGIAFKFVRSGRKEDGESPKESSNESLITPRVLLVGFLTGLGFSLAGRFGMDLPVKMFNFPREQSHRVHLIAPVLYAVVFVYVSFLMKLE